MFEFGNALRIRVYVSASGVFVESISHAEMRDSFGIVRLSGKPGDKLREKRKHGKASVGESWKTGGSGIVCFPFVSPGVMMGEGDSHGVGLWLIDGYDVFVIDIYYYDRP